MSALITIVTPALIERYVEGELSCEDRATVENAIKNDERAKRSVIKALWVKAGLPLSLLVEAERIEKDAYGSVEPNDQAAEMNGL